MRTKLLTLLVCVLCSLCLQAQTASNSIYVKPSGACACFGVTCSSLTSDAGDPTVTMTTDPGAWHCWNWGDGTYSSSGSSASATHTYTNTGTFIVSVFIQNPAPGGTCATCPNTACNLTDSCIKKISIITTSVNKGIAGGSNFSMNPMQEKGKFLVTMENVYLNKELEIFNALGQKVYVLPLRDISTEIDLSHLPKGIYFYRLISPDGSNDLDLIQAEKLVIQ